MSPEWPLEDDFSLWMRFCELCEYFLWNLVADFGNDIEADIYKHCLQGADWCKFEIEL